MSLRDLILDFFILALLVFVQIFVFNNIHFMGWANPLVYLIFLLLFPVQRNRYLYLSYAFLLGLSIDFFEHSLGTLSFACILTAFLRPFFLWLIASDKLKNKDSFTLSKLNLGQLILLLMLMVLSHQFTLYLLQHTLSIDWSLFIIENAITLGITVLFIGLFLLFLPPKRLEQM